MQWEPKRNEHMTPNSKPNTDEQRLRTFEQKIEIALEKAMKPALDRLEKLEAQDKTPITRSFLNGSKIPISHYQQTNQSHIHYYD